MPEEYNALSSIERVPEDYLEHHGVRGMKWGVRRYQNKDGTLTPKGRARLLEDARKYERKANVSVAENYFAKSRRARLKQKAKDARAEILRSDLAKSKLKEEKEESSKHGSVKLKSDPRKMTDDELNYAINRLTNEQKYLSKYNELNPKKVNTGREFVKNFAKEAILKPGMDIFREKATAYITDYMRESLGIEDPKAQMNALNKKYDRLALEEKILKSKKNKIDLENYINDDNELRKTVQNLKMQQEKKQKEDFLNGKSKDGGNTMTDDNVEKYLREKSLDEIDELYRKLKEEKDS